MDYTDLCGQPSTTRRLSFCKKLTEGFLFVGVLGLVYLSCTLYIEIQSIKDEIYMMKGGNKSNASRKAVKVKSKSYDNRMKLLLSDPVDRPDFALESTGGKVLQVDAAVYTPSPHTFFGFTLCEGQHGPSAMIHATQAPGECWAFKGHVATATIELIGYVLIDGVTLEHIPKSLSPTGSIDSAPKEFKIWGMDDSSGHNKRLLGQFCYDADGDAIQMFHVNGNTNYYKYVVFEVLTNQGNEQFTCVYRIRVHGSMSRL